ncbi:hypothetical protein ACYF6T_29105 [Streptomyces sp. 7R007]
MTHEPTPEWEVMTGPGGAEPPPGAGPGGVWRRRSRPARAVIASAAVVVLALGGTVAYAASSGGSGQGATPSASGSASPSSDGRDGRFGHGPWFGAGGMGVHGESTVKDQDTGKWVVRIWQRGTVEKADGEQVTVKSEDGASWKWTVGKDATVFHDGTRGSGTGDLTKGETVFLVGTRAGDGTRTATHVMAGTADDDGPGRFPGRGPKGWRTPAPPSMPSPSTSGATA